MPRRPVRQITTADHAARTTAPEANSKREGENGEDRPGVDRAAPAEQNRQNGQHRAERRTRPAAVRDGRDRLGRHPPPQHGEPTIRCHASSHREQGHERHPRFTKARTDLRSSNRARRPKRPLDLPPTPPRHSHRSAFVKRPGTRLRHRSPRQKRFRTCCSSGVSRCCSPHPTKPSLHPSRTPATSRPSSIVRSGFRPWRPLCCSRRGPNPPLVPQLWMRKAQPGYTARHIAA